MSPIEPVWDFVGWNLARETRSVADTVELWFRIETILNELPQVEIENPFDSLPRRIEALTAAYGGSTKY